MPYHSYPDGKLRPEFELSVLFPIDSQFSWFQSLATQLVSPDVSILSDHEDDRPTQYSFSSPHLTGLSPEDTLCRANKLLALLSGALLVLGYKWMSKPLTMEQGWYWDSTMQHRVFIGNKQGFVLEFPKEIADFSYRAWPENMSLSIEGKLIFLCRSDSATFSILTILGHRGVTFESLYSVYDCLTGAGLNQDNVAQLAGVTKKYLKRFTATANHFGVLGVQARHGNLNWDLPADPPLSLEDSAKLILTAAKRFLLGRVESRFPSAWAAVDGPQQ